MYRCIVQNTNDYTPKQKNYTSSKQNVVHKNVLRIQIFSTYVQTYASYKNNIISIADNIIVVLTVRS